MNGWAIVLAILGATMLAGGCGEKKTGNASGLPVVQMTIGGKQFMLEVANTEETMARGLMHRDSMPADRGMIFVFPSEDERTFWMKDTRIPLDIIYVDSAGKVVSVKSMKPYDLTAVPSDGPVLYAIELNQGTAASLGVKAGDVLRIPAEIHKLPAGKG